MRIPHSPTRPRSRRSYDISICCWNRPIWPSRSQPAQGKQVFLTRLVFNRNQARCLSHMNAFPAPQSLRADLRAWQGPHRWRLLYCCRRLPLPLAGSSNAFGRRYPSAEWTLTTAHRSSQRTPHRGRWGHQGGAPAISVEATESAPAPAGKRHAHPRGGDGVPRLALRCRTALPLSLSPAGGPPQRWSRGCKRRR